MQNDKFKLITYKTGLMAATIQISIFSHYTDSKNNLIWIDIYHKLKDIEKKMSFFNSSSEIALINQNAGKRYVKVSEDTIYVIERSKYISDLTSGKFDITIGKLVDAWKIKKNYGIIPNNEEIQRILEYINYKNILIDAKKETIKLKKEGMMIDLGGIAKGYVADEVEKIINNHGICSAIIDLGGNIKVTNVKPDSLKWKISIQNPFEIRGNNIGFLSLSNKSIVTAGIYERCFHSNGKSYHHILSVENGYPVDNDVASVTIISDSSIDGDGLSTAALVLGIENGIKFINSQKNIEGIFINKNLEIFVTNGLVDRLYITNNKFKIVTQ